MDVERSMMSNGYSPSVASSRRHGTRNGSGSRPSSTARTMSRNVRRLQEAVNLHLNNYEKELFLDALNEYNSHKDSWGFVELLRTILNTPAKQLLVPMIRLVLPPADIPEFDKCVQLSAAVARGEQGAGRLTGGSPSIASRTEHRPRSRSAHKYSTAPVRLKAVPHSDYGRSADKGELRVIQISPDVDGIGFTIKSLHQGKQGVFVSSVDPRSHADAQGLSVGDEILEANDIDLSQTTNEDASLIMRAARSLTLTVRSGGNQSSQETYTWVDTDGRSCSPPPSQSELHSTMRSSVSKRSGMTLLSSQDERKINLRIDKGHGLGLTIRGGSEYGLGIYITGVDEGSSAKRLGIRVGDQVLAVNDVQFIDITHKDAVKALKRSRHMMLTIKHVGKLPHAKIDDRKLLVSGRSRSATGRRSRSQSRRHNSSSTEDIHRQSRMRYPGSLDRRKFYEQQPDDPAPIDDMPGFSKGAGSQLMLSRSMMLPQQLLYTSTQPSNDYALVEEQAKNLLNDNERGALKFYVDEYSKSYISVDALVAALKELFNTQAKFEMFHELRCLIRSRDVEKYDQLVIKIEVSSLKSRHERSQDQMSDFSLDSVLSARSTNSTNDSLTLNLSANQKPPILSSRSNASTKVVENGSGSVRSNKMFVTDGSNQAVITDPQSVSMSKERSMVTTAEINHYSSSESSPRDSSKTVPRMGVRAAKISPKPDGRAPSEDSGVDVRAKGTAASQSRSSYTDTVTRRKGSPNPPPVGNSPDSTDSDDSSIQAVREQYRQSYSMSGSANLNSEDEHIPGLHSDLDVSGHDNVVLVQSKDVGTLPRRKSKSKDEEEITPRRSVTPTFREQVQNRSALSGKIYLPPPASKPVSQRHEIALSDTDYDTLDILNISKELYASTLEAEGKAEVPQPTDPSSGVESLPPPPPHLLHDASSNNSTLENRGYSQDHTKGSAVSHYETVDLDDGGLDEMDQTEDLHPAVLQGRSPKSERKSPRGKSDKNIYAVIKKQSPKPARPTMSFEAPLKVGTEMEDDSSPVTTPLGPDVPLKMEISSDRERSSSEDSLPQEEVIRVNKLRSTLGLAIEGGAGTKQPIPRIINIQETGCAHNSELKVGHLILRVNDRYLDGLSHNQSARAIADAFRDRTTAYLDFLVKQ